MARSARRIWLSVAAVVATAGAAVVISGVVFFSRHVRTEYNASVETATREFEGARGRLADPNPLVEYRWFDPPRVHRTPSAPRQPLVAVHVVAYDANSRELRRIDLPISFVRTMTAGGTIRLVNLGEFGDDRDRITLADLERHGPGLVVDVAGDAVGLIPVTDARFGRKSKQSRLLCWTD